MSEHPREGHGQPWRRLTAIRPAPLAGYQRSWLRHDVIAAVTVWAVLIPESLAYATIAGVPPVVGLYAAAPALVVYALLGSSRHLVVGPMSATAALSATIAAAYSDGSAEDYLTVSIALTVITGVVAILAGLCRLGFVAAFISEPVLKGFIVGLALTIMIGQVPALLGLEKPEAGFFGAAWQLLRDLPDLQPATAVVGLCSLAAVLALRRWVPLVPASLAVVLAGIVAVKVWDLEERGVEVVGAIDPGLPSLGLPGAGWERYADLVGPAAAVVLIGFVEGLAAAKAYAARDGYDIDASRELVALGGANLGSGVLGGMVVNGSLSKTAVNGSAGARSQLSNIIVGALTLVTLALLTGLFETLPDAVLAAVVITAVVELVDLSAIRGLYGVWSSRLGRIYRHAARADFVAAVGALVGVLVLDTLIGLVVGVVISFVLLLQRASRPHVARLVRLPGDGGEWAEADRHPSLAPDPRVVVLRIEGPLFFANSEHVRTAVRAAAAAEPAARAVVIDGGSVASIDVTGADMLAQVERDLAARGVSLHFARSIGQVRDVLAHTPGEDSAEAPLARVHRSVDEALADLGLPAEEPGA